jgi:hypothetical protein
MSRKAMSATPSMTNVSHATMGSKSMKPTTSAMPSAAPATVECSKPTAPAVKATAATPAAMSAAATSTPMSCECRDVRHEAKRAHRNTRRQNAYCLLLHDAFPSSKS